MAITIIKEPGKYSFVGNTIVFELLTDSPDFIHFEISAGGENYSAIFYPTKIAENQYKIRANISDYLKFESNIEIPEGEVIIPIQNFSLEYHVRIGSEYQFTGNALCGGISNSEIIRLEKINSDIFENRLTNYSSQFLFTTRTNGKEIKIKETELFPFVFIHPGVDMYFSAIDSMHGVFIPSKPFGTICVIDVKSLLKEFLIGRKIIYVSPGNLESFYFQIIPGKLSEEKYLIKFKNSLGAFEMLEVTGSALNKPKFSEENLYEYFNQSNFYEERRSRVKCRKIIAVETGYKERNEFPFIIDMIQSDETYFIYPDGNSFRCHVKCDIAEYGEIITKPTSIKLDIIETYEEEFTISNYNNLQSGISVLLNLSPTYVNINAGDEFYLPTVKYVTVNITGTDNKDYTVQDIPSWLSIFKEGTTFGIIAERNLSSERTALLKVVSDENPNVYKSLFVNQSGVSSISVIVTPNLVEADHTAQDYNIAVTITGTDNKSYDVQGLVGGVQVVNKTDSGFTLRFSEYNDLSGVIFSIKVVSSTDSNAYDTLNVMRSGKPQIPTISINPERYTFSEGVGNINIDVTITPNQSEPYSIFGNPSWLTVYNKTQSGFSLSVPSNVGGANRFALLTIRLVNYIDIGIDNASFVQLGGGAIPYDIYMKNTPFNFISSAYYRDVEVVIVGDVNQPYSVELSDTSGWINITNKTQSSFRINRTENILNVDRSMSITVRLDNYPSKYHTTTITQLSAEQKEFYFIPEVMEINSTDSSYKSIEAVMIGFPPNTDTIPAYTFLFELPNWMINSVSDVVTDAGINFMTYDNFANTLAFDSIATIRNFIDFKARVCVLKESFINRIVVLSKETSEDYIIFNCQIISLENNLYIIDDFMEPGAFFTINGMYLQVRIVKNWDFPYLIRVNLGELPYSGYPTIKYVVRKFLTN